MLVDVNASSFGCHVLPFAAVRTVAIQKVPVSCWPAE